IDALGLIGGNEAIPDLMRLLQSPNLEVCRVAATALVNMEATGAADIAVEPWQNGPARPDSDGRPASYAYLAGGVLLEHLRPSSVLPAIELIYRDPSRLEQGRWLAHYWGGGSEDAELICSFLGRADPEPALPRERGDARKTLKVLGLTWDQSKSA